MHSKKDTVIICHIMQVISKLHSVGCMLDYEDNASNASKQYTKYLKEFKRAKMLLSLTADTSDFHPLHNPRHLFWEAERAADDPDAIRAYFRLKQFQYSIEQDFDALDNPIIFPTPKG